MGENFNPHKPPFPINPTSPVFSLNVLILQENDFHRKFVKYSYASRKVVTLITHSGRALGNEMLNLKSSRSKVQKSHQVKKNVISAKKVFK